MLVFVGSPRRPILRSCTKNKTLKKKQLLDPKKKKKRCDDGWEGLSLVIGAVKDQGTPTDLARRAVVVVVVVDGKRLDKHKQQSTSKHNDEWKQASLLAPPAGVSSREIKPLSPLDVSVWPDTTPYPA